MRMLRKTATALVAVALGVGLAACGEDREGDVQFQGTETTGTGTTGTETTGTTATETTGTETTGTETTP
jgi:uncharacterized lipoprotein YehR (DUF1307 family)